MTAYLDDVQYWETANNQVKMLGWIRGMQSGKKYSLKWLHYPDEGLVHSDGREYTYISGSSFNDWSLTAHNAYIPEQGGENGYSVTLEEVGVNCEDYKDTLDIADVNPTPQEQDKYWITYRVFADGVGLGDVSILVNNSDTGEKHYLTTNSAGLVDEQLPTGSWRVRISAQSGYISEVSDVSFTANKDKIITLKLSKADTTKKCAFNVYVHDTETNQPMVDARLQLLQGTTPVAYGPTDEQGKRTLTGTCGAQCQILARKEGYKPVGIRKTLDGVQPVILSMKKPEPGEPTDDCPEIHADFNMNPVGKRVEATNGEIYYAFVQGTKITFTGASTTDGSRIASEIWEAHGGLRNDGTGSIIDIGAKQLEPWRTSGHVVSHTFRESDRISVWYTVKNDCGRKATKQVFLVTTDPEGKVPAQDMPVDPQSGEADPSCLPDILPDIIKFDPTFILSAPAIALCGNVEVTGTAPPGITINIELVKSFFGLDSFAKDEILGYTQANSDGKFSKTILLEDIGVYELRGRIKQSAAGIDWLKADLTTSKVSIFVLNYIIIGIATLLLFLVLNKATGGKIIGRK